MGLDAVAEGVEPQDEAVAHSDDDAAHQRAQPFSSRTPTSVTPDSPYRSGA